MTLDLRDVGRTPNPHVVRGALAVEALAVAAVAALPVVVALLRGLVVAGSDLGAMFIPNQAWWWGGARWLGGWNAALFGGYPANADPLVGQWYPPGAVYALLRPDLAAAADAAATSALAGIGMLLYLAAVGCGRSARLLGALAWALGGFVAAHAPHPPIVRGAATLPFLLAAIEALDGRRLAAGVAAATALLAISGHPQTMLYAALAAGAYAVACARPSPARLATMAAGGLLGLALAAPAWLPAAQLVPRSVRALVDATQHADPHLAPLELLGLAAPLVPMRCAATECSTYPGMAPLLLVLAALPLARRDRRLAFWIALAALGVLLATGVLPSALPGVRAPTRFLLWTSLGLAAAAGIACERLRTASLPAWWPLATAAPVAAALVVAAQAAPAAVLPAAVALVASCAALALLASRGTAGPTSVALLAVAATDLVLFAGAVLPAVPPAAYAAVRGGAEAVARSQPAIVGTAPQRALVVPTLPGANWASLAGAHLLQGYNALAPADLYRLLSSRPPTPLAEIGYVDDASLASPDNHVLDLLRCALVVAPDPPLPGLGAAIAADPRWRRLDAAPRPGLAAYANGRVRPLAWLVTRTRVLDPATAFDVVRGAVPGADFDPKREALVAAALPDVADAPLGDVAVELTTWSDDEIVLLVRAERTALLVTSEPDFPGWHADVDGAARPVLRVNAAFRGVVVPAGAHTVRLAYRPATTRIGLVVALVAALAIAWCAVSPARPAPAGTPGRRA